MNRPLATTGTPSGYIPGEPPYVTAARMRMNGNGSAPTAQPPAPSTQNPAPYVAPDVPGALPGEPPAVTAMRQRLNGNGNGSAAPAPPDPQAQLLDDIAKGQLGPKASFAKLSADQQDVVRRIAASIDPTPKAAGAVSRTIEPSGTAPAPAAPAPAAPAPAAPPTPEEMAAPFKIDQAAYEAAQQARQAAGEAKHSGAADAWATEMANRLFANKVTPQDYQLLAPKYDPKGIDSSLDIVARNNGKSMITPASKMSADTLLKTRFRLQTLWNNSRPAAAPPFGQSGILTPQ
jgi:hypothetical protein